MTIYTLDKHTPRFADRARAWIAPDTSVIGRVAIGLDVSLWFKVVVRADNEEIALGDRCNVQDGAVLHADPGAPCVIGEDVTIGHRAIIHGATVGPRSLVGMGAIVLNRAVIGAECLVGAGALVAEGKTFPDGSLIVGVPARLVRPLTPEERAALPLSAAGYVANGQRFAAGLTVADDGASAGH